MLLEPINLSKLLWLEVESLKLDLVKESPVSPVFNALGRLPVVEAHEDTCRADLDPSWLVASEVVEEASHLVGSDRLREPSDMQTQVLHGLFEAESLLAQLSLPLLLRQGLLHIEAADRVRLLGFLKVCECSPCICRLLKADKSEALRLLILVPHHDSTRNLPILGEDLLKVAVIEVSTREILQVEVSEVWAGRARPLLRCSVLGDAEDFSRLESKAIHLSRISNQIFTYLRDCFLSLLSRLKLDVPETLALMLSVQRHLCTEYLAAPLESPVQIAVHPLGPEEPLDEDTVLT